MKKVTFLLALTLLAPLSAKAGKIVTDSLSSAILGATLKYNVYLPDGFGKTDRQYPVVYLLHGLSDDYTAWEGKGQMSRVADELIRSGEVLPMVIVMPGAGCADTHNTYNGYFNMPGWSYEDFFFKEFVPQVEKRYNIYGDKGHRAIMGLSMGGGGSTAYAQRHSDMFSSCYAMSAWLDTEIATNLKPGDKLILTQNSVRETSALKFIDNADEQAINALRTVKWFIDCGDDDFLLDLSCQLYQKMRAKKIKAEFRVRDGIHNWEYWHNALRMSLPFASRNFDR